MKKTIIIFVVLTKIFGQSNHKNLIIDLTDKNGKNYFYVHSAIEKNIGNIISIIKLEGVNEKNNSR